ncbi:SpoIIE family protein phosphatase [bacterium]|nr:SpoIIE family protein phosphatase [bacterium]
MRKAFRKKLLIVVAIAILVASFFSLDIVDRNCRTHAGKLFLETYKDTVRALNLGDKQSYELRSNMMHSVLSSLETVAEVVDSFPSVLGKDSKVLVRLCNGLGLSRIDIIDSVHNVIAVSSDILIVGGGARSDRSAPYDPSSDFCAFVNSIGTYRQVEYVLDSKGRELLLFSAPLSRHPGFLVRLGISAESFKTTYNIAENQFIYGSLPIGETGGVDIVENGVIKNSPNEHLVGRRVEEVYDNLILPEDTYNFNAANEKEHSLLPVKRDGLSCYYSVYQTERYKLVCYMSVREIYATRRTVFSAMLVIFAIIFVSIFFAASYLVRMIMIDGLDRINDSLAEIEGGDLNVRVEEDSYPEFSVLSQGINSTVDALKNLMERQVAHDAEQMELARTIQLSCLPKYFPTYPELRSMDLCALTEPAQEVGGDFYDYFRISDSLYGVMIADVSEHGIPAALLMMTAKTAIHDAVLSGDSLERCVESVNISLCENNATGMFVTAFVGIMNVASGEFKFVNAGHCRPILYKNGRWQEIKVNSCFVLGGLDNLSYASQSWQLEPGDKVFLYTDGVTEALNEDGEFFGAEGLLKVLNGEKGRSYDCASLINYVKAALDEFADDRRGIGDDVTMLAFEYFGSRGSDKFLEVNSSGDELDRILDFVEDLLDRKADLQEEALARIKTTVSTVIDDIFTNITSYSGAEKDCKVLIRAEIQDCPKQLTVHFIDGGRPYDPTAIETPNVNLSFEERRYGGLGVHLVKNLTDRMTYRYKDGCNILCLIKKLE